MHSDPPSPKPAIPDRITQGIFLLWLLALLFAVVNGLFVMRRVPVLREESKTRDELAAQAAAVWLRQEPTGARLLLLRSHKDIGATWFNFRLNYLIYPRRHDSAWETLPPNAAHNYDLVLALGAARAAVPPDWTPLHATGFATLFAPAPSPRPISGPLPLAASSPGVVGLAVGVLGLAAVIALGALLLGWTTGEAPFRFWWANLAVAHLIGATALAWLVTVMAGMTGRLLLWPVYLLLVLLLPGARRAYARIFVCVSEKSEKNESEQELPAPPKENVLPFVTLCVIALGLVMTLLGAWLLGIGWDGYSIWQFKAQAFVMDGDMSILRDLHYTDYAHLDYPPLVSLQTWWVSAHAGGYNERWAQAIGFLFGLDLVALFSGFARRHLSREHLLLGVALLVTVPTVCTHAVSGFADIELACWLLALGMLLSRVGISDDLSARPVLAWICAGIVLVKNEGLLALVAGLTVLLVMRRRRDLAGLAATVAAAGAAYLPWLRLKRVWHLNNDLLESGRTPHLTRGLVIWRLGTALKGFALCLARTGPRAGGWGLLILLLPIGLVQTLRRRIAICYPLWLLCAIQLIGYVAIYIITPLPLLRHLATSVDRLTLHLVPTLLLAALLGTFGRAANSEQV